MSQRTVSSDKVGSLVYNVCGSQVRKTTATKVFTQMQTQKAKIHTTRATLPGLCHPPVSDHLQYPKTERKAWKILSRECSQHLLGRQRWRWFWTTLKFFSCTVLSNHCSPKCLWAWKLTNCSLVPRPLPVTVCTNWVHHFRSMTYFWSQAFSRFFSTVAR